MFLVTGDVHADMNAFRKRNYGRPGREDCIIVCGDFGVLWDGSQAEKKMIKNLGKQKYKTLFIDGAHENFDLLRKYPVSEWNGGKVQVIEGSLIHLMRGQVYLINGKRIFTFGGGESVDREMRKERVSWWQEEFPTEEEMKEGTDNLEAGGWEVDYIFTYEAPAGILDFIFDDNRELNALNIYLDQIRRKCGYEKWIFGCYHKNKRLSNKHEMIFDQVIRLN
jgi:hypothetical protein